MLCRKEIITNLQYQEEGRGRCNCRSFLRLDWAPSRQQTWPGPGPAWCVAPAEQPHSVFSVSHQIPNLIKIKIIRFRQSINTDCQYIIQIKSGLNFQITLTYQWNSKYLCLRCIQVQLSVPSEAFRRISHDTHHPLPWTHWDSSPCLGWLYL